MFVGQARWLERCLAAAGISSGDWFRLAQNRVERRKRIQAAFPDQYQGDRDGRFGCWVCQMTFEHGNSRQVHYDQTHAARLSECGQLVFF